MKFSIIIPVYNAEKYVEPCINKLMQQTFQDFEIVLINDGSTDKTKSICEEYMSLFPKKIRVFHQENKGQLLTRHRGISEANGEYCVFLDVDDELATEGLETLNGAIEAHDNPDMLIYSFFYDDLSGNKKKAQSLFEDNKVVKGAEKKAVYEKFFTTTLLNNVWTKAVKRSCLERDSMDYSKYAKLRCSEDRLHSMGMVSCAETIAYIKEPLYIYKLMPNSVSRTFDMSAVERFNVKVLYEEELNYIKKWNLDIHKWQERLDAGYILQTWYILEQFYNRAVGRALKKQVLTYNWKKFIPEHVLNTYKTNAYLNDIQKKCWQWILDKDSASLRKYFVKKAMHSTMKKMKRKITRRK